MNTPLDIARHSSVCPHDCPSVCALDVEVIGGNRIGRVHGAPDHPYTYVWTYMDPARLQPVLAGSGPRVTTADVYPAS
jgi:Molybdopterin oxidoreductase Fe4S4 domain